MLQSEDSSSVLLNRPARIDEELFKLAVNALKSEKLANFAVNDLLPLLSSNQLDQATQLVIENFEQFKREQKMIRNIELVDFLAHSNTKLEFENDATVFVGDNGAGKSSIIDAITFSLFGEHTRKNNKGLIRRGANQGFAKIEFSANGKNYQAIRKIDSKGTLTAQFAEDVNGKLIPIAEGERKQFGESMTKHVEETLGMDFEKLQIASIVRQGELNSIIKAKPKEFKELLNAIIGIDKLDTALTSMRTVQREFRTSIQEKFGYNDTQIQFIENKITEFENESANARNTLEQLAVEKKEEEVLTLKT